MPNPLPSAALATALLTVSATALAHGAGEHARIAIVAPVDGGSVRSPLTVRLHNEGVPIAAAGVNRHKAAPRIGFTVAPGQRQ